MLSVFETFCHKSYLPWFVLQVAPQRTEAEIQEEEELQLALALSKSEEENKAKEVRAELSLLALNLSSTSCFWPLNHDLFFRQRWKNTIQRKLKMLIVFENIMENEAYWLLNARLLYANILDLDQIKLKLLYPENVI